jgi:hypothetical protein
MVVGSTAGERLDHADMCTIGYVHDRQEPRRRALAWAVSRLAGPVVIR